MAPTDTTDNLRELRPRPSRAEIDPLASELLRTHGAEVMASAERWADTPEDAEDAYQRGMEILLLKAPSIDPDHLVPWLKTVVKHEAWAIRRQRERQTPPAGEHEELDSPGPATAHDQAERIEQLRRGAEALARLKPNEVRALVLKAEGLSYQEICDETGWTYTKVNRSLSEGRRRFQERLARIESGAECARLEPLLSRLADGEALAEDMALLRPHLRTCLTCRARLREYRAAPAKVAALAPPLVGGSLLASARGLFEGAAGWISERSASMAVRWHQAGELAAAHKVGAVAASAAVLAGGGAATVAGVDGGDRPAAVRPPPAASVAPSPPPVPSADGRAGRRRGSSAPSGVTRRPAPNRETPSGDRDPAPVAPAPGESSQPPPPAGEFTPGPASAEGPAARPKPPAPAAGSEPSAGGEFAP